MILCFTLQTPIHKVLDHEAICSLAGSWCEIIHKSTSIYLHIYFVNFIDNIRKTKGGFFWALKVCESGLKFLATVNRFFVFNVTMFSEPKACKLCRWRERELKPVSSFSPLKHQPSMWCKVCSIYGSEQLLYVECCLLSPIPPLRTRRFRCLHNVLPYLNKSCRWRRPCLDWKCRNYSSEETSGCGRSKRVVFHLNLFKLQIAVHVSFCTLITSIFCGYDEAASVMLSVEHRVCQAQKVQRHLPKCVDVPEIKHPRWQERDWKACVTRWRLEPDACQCTGAGLRFPTLLSMTC